MTITMMMVVIGMMMMRLLCGTKAIKNGSPRKQKIKKEPFDMLVLKMYY